MKKGIKRFYYYPSRRMATKRSVRKFNRNWKGIKGEEK